MCSVNPLVSVDLLRVQGHGLALSESPCGSDNHWQKNWKSLTTFLFSNQLGDNKKMLTTWLETSSRILLAFLIFSSVYNRKQPLIPYCNGLHRLWNPPEFQHENVATASSTELRLLGLNHNVKKAETWSFPSLYGNHYIHFLIVSYPLQCQDKQGKQSHKKDSKVNKVPQKQLQTMDLTQNQRCRDHA